LVLEVEIDQNCDGNDVEVDREPQPGEEGALVGAMVAGIGGDVGEEEGRVERQGKEQLQ
jgi:hypothetical protein